MAQNQLIVQHVVVKVLDTYLKLIIVVFVNINTLMRVFFNVLSVIIHAKLVLILRNLIALNVI